MQSRHEQKVTVPKEVLAEGRDITLRVDPVPAHLRVPVPDGPPDPPADPQSVIAAFKYFDLQEGQILLKRALTEADLNWLNTPRDPLGLEPTFTFENTEGGIRMQTGGNRSLFWFPELKVPCYWCGYNSMNALTGKLIPGFVYKGPTDVPLHPPRCRVCPDCGGLIILGRQDFYALLNAKDSEINKTAIKESMRRKRPAGVSPAARKT